MAKEVATVRRDLDVENGVAGEKIADRRADLRFRRQNQKTGRVRTEPELDCAAKHSFAFDTAEFAFPNLGTVWQLRAGKRERNFVAHFVIGRTANDLTFNATAIIHFANRQTIRIWMTRRRGDSGNDDPAAAGSIYLAACFDAFGLDTRPRQQIRDIFGIFWKIDKFAQPINRKFHANWRRKRKSFCENNRMSGMSNKIMASRSIPRPNA